MVFHRNFSIFRCHKPYTYTSPSLVSLCPLVLEFPSASKCLEGRLAGLSVARFPLSIARPRSPGLRRICFYVRRLSETPIFYRLRGENTRLWPERRPKLWARWEAKARQLGRRSSPPCPHRSLSDQQACVGDTALGTCVLQHACEEGTCALGQEEAAAKAARR